MPDDFTYDVLSHSAKDLAVVRDVAERSRKDGVKVWFDEGIERSRAGALHVGECVRLGLGALESPARSAFVTR